MMKELPEMPMPEWLVNLTANSAFPPWKSLLADSLYYPACGLNGTPVKFLAGNVYSFVYADYGVGGPEFLINLNGNGPDCGFEGYHSILQRPVHWQDIVPEGWVPGVRPALLDVIPVRNLNERPSGRISFGHWSVWEKDETNDCDTAPARFSFLFLRGEMSVVYQALYCRNETAPKVLAIIQPGSGLGGGWENTESADSVFHQAVQSNPAGFPEYLLHGGFGRGFYEQACWPEYTGERLCQLPERYAGLWKLNGSPGSGRKAPGFMNKEPMWRLLQNAAQKLTKDGLAPFSRSDLIASVREVLPDAQENSINPVIQGITDNLEGGAPGTDGKRILHSVERGKFVLLSAYERELRIPAKEPQQQPPRKPVTTPKLAMPATENALRDLIVEHLKELLQSIDCDFNPEGKLSYTLPSGEKLRHASDILLSVSNSGRFVSIEIKYQSAVTDQFKCRAFDAMHMKQDHGDSILTIMLYAKSNTGISIAQAQRISYSFDVFYGASAEKFLVAAGLRELANRILKFFKSE